MKSLRRKDTTLPVKSSKAKRPLSSSSGSSPGRSASRVGPPPPAADLLSKSKRRILVDLTDDDKSTPGQTRFTGDEDWDRAKRSFSTPTKGRASQVSQLLNTIPSPRSRASSQPRTRSKKTDKDAPLKSDPDKTRAASWNEVMSTILAIQGLEDSGAASGSPGKAPRFEDPTSREKPPKPIRLPLHPTISSGLSHLASEVADDSFATKSRPTEVLPVGSFLSGERRVSQTYFSPAGMRAFLSPASLNEDFPSLSADKPASVSNSREQDLKTDEILFKELLAIQSLAKWARLTFESLTASLGEAQSDSDRETIAAHLASLSLQMKSLDADMEDRLATRLANTLLRRRDLHLASLNGPQLPDHMKTLRGAPFAHKHLFGDLPADMVASTKKLQQADVLQKLATASATQKRQPSFGAALSSADQRHTQKQPQKKDSFKIPRLKESTTQLRQRDPKPTTQESNRDRSPSAGHSSSSNRGKTKRGGTSGSSFRGKGRGGHKK